MTELHPVDSKLCCVCEATIFRRPGQALCDFARKQTCGAKDCINELKKRRRDTIPLEDTPPKTCIICRRTYYRRPDESYKKWQGRVTCGDTDCRVAMTQAGQAEARAQKLEAEAASHRGVMELPGARLIGFLRTQATEDDYRIATRGMSAAELKHLRDMGIRR